MVNMKPAFTNWPQLGSELTILSSYLIIEFYISAYMERKISDDWKLFLVPPTSKLRKVASSLNKVQKVKKFKKITNSCVQCELKRLKFIWEIFLI